VLISVQLFVQGAGLRPSLITDLIQIQPDTAYAFGELWTSKSGKTNSRKIGLWKWGIHEDSPEVQLSELVVRFCDRLNRSGANFSQLPDAERTWIDVFACDELSASAATELFFILTPAALTALSDVGLPVEFSSNLVLSASKCQDSADRGSTGSSL
jgi:hypothetical protein